MFRETFVETIVFEALDDVDEEGHKKSPTLWGLRTGRDSNPSPQY